MGSLEPRLEPPAAERPYWHFNCPASESTEECPPFLQSASEYDKMQLSILDSDYSIMSWPVLCNIIAENKLNHLRRVPSELRKYFEFRYRVLQKYGSMMEFILTKLLKWEEPIVAEAAPYVLLRFLLFAVDIFLYPKFEHVGYLMAYRAITESE